MHLLTAYELEAFLYSSRPGGEVKPDAKRRLEALILLDFFKLCILQKNNNVMKKTDFDICLSPSFSILCGYNALYTSICVALIYV